MAHWRCSRGHEYSATVKSRTSLGTGCPHCSYNVSKPQKRLFVELAIAFPSVSIKIEERIGANRVDLSIPNLQIAIEYDGARYHRGLKKSGSDSRKSHALRELGFRLIRVREFGLVADPEAHCVMLPKVHKELSKESVDEVVRLIMQLSDDRVSTEAAVLYLDKPSFLAEEAYQLIARKKRLDEETLVHQNPELAAEWSPKNADSPSDVTPGSHDKRWWDCRVCSWSWLAAIGSRNLGHGCPACANQVPTETNNLSVVFPLVAERLHPTRNAGRSGADFTPYSNQKVWWRCSRGHQWESTISNQVKAKVGCELCLGKRATPERNLATKYPHVAALLNEERSGVKASEIPPHSGKPYWWRCESGHEWERTADHQTRGKGGCPLCRGKWIPRSCAD
jgi:very-short-patch-repair endonuclease